MDEIFPKTIKSLQKIHQFIADFLSDRQVGQETRYQIELAVEEVFVNAVKHNMGTGEDIRIFLNIDDNMLHIRFVDKNVEPFDPTMAKKVDVTQPIEERIPGGLGLFLIQSILDDVQYNWDNGISTITLIKDLRDDYVRDKDD